MAKKKAVQKKAAQKRAPAAKSSPAQIGKLEGPELEPVAAVETRKKERPVRCIHRHTDVELRREFRRVCKGLIEKAAGGGVQHTRLLLHIGKFDQPNAKKRRAEPSLSAMLLGELKYRQDEREAAANSKEADDDAAEMPQSATSDKANEGATSEHAEKQ